MRLAAEVSGPFPRARTASRTEARWTSVPTRGGSGPELNSYLMRALHYLLRALHWTMLPYDFANFSAINFFVSRLMLSL
jgi:hypothetical protein